MCVCVCVCVYYSSSLSSLSAASCLTFICIYNYVCQLLDLVHGEGEHVVRDVAGGDGVAGADDAQQLHEGLLYYSMIIYL